MTTQGISNLIDWNQPSFQQQGIPYFLLETTDPNIYRARVSFYGELLFNFIDGEESIVLLDSQPFPFPEPQPNLSDLYEAEQWQNKQLELELESIA